MRTVPRSALVLLALLLAGCAPQNASVSPATGAASTSPTATAEPEIVEEFAMPTACADILGAEHLSDIEADGAVLLGGPGGLYGDDYLLEPSPEQQAGGITCIWGDPETEISTVTISVAPLTASSRQAVVADLAISQGLNETIGETADYYWQLGDDDHEPAILNVLTSDSWISVIQTVGGDANYTAAEQLALDVHEQVYRAS